MFSSVSARQIQRNYKKILAQANKKGEPIEVISGNKLQGAVIGLDLLEKLRLDVVVSEAMKDYREGKTKSISTLEELEADFEQMRTEAKPTDGHN